VEGLNLLAQQIAPGEGGMLDAGFGGVIALPVMTLSKDGNAVDVSVLHGLGKEPGIEFGTDVRNEWRGMKVEVDLTAVTAEKILEGLHGNVGEVGI
jgi:hypothetical protein